MDLRFEVHLHVHRADVEKHVVLPGPAELNPFSPEADLRWMFGENYGDGKAIPLAEDDPCFAEKQALLEAALRVWDKTRKCWVHRA